MSMFSLHVDGMDELREGFAEWELRVGEAAVEWVTKGGEQVADRAKEVFAGGSGAATWRGANFPIPTSHSGFLRNSIGTSNITKFEGGASSETGPRTVYGRRIELGYTGHPLGGSHPAGLWPYFTTRPFPFLKPGLEHALPGLETLFNEVIAATMEG